MQDIMTICNYCGFTCGVFLSIGQNHVVGSYPSRNYPISRRNLYSKDWHLLKFIHLSKRLTESLLCTGEKLKAVSWFEALNYRASAFKDAKAFTVISEERKYGYC